jgi:hypothetical protein
MTLSRFRDAVLVCVIIMILPNIALSDDATPATTADTPASQIVQMKLVDKDDAGRDLGYGNCQWLAPRDAPKEKLFLEPKFKSNKPIYYAATFGDSKDSIFSFVLDESEGTGKGYDTIYVDADNDNRIDEEKERYKITIGNPAHSDKNRIRLQVTSGGVTAPYGVSLSAFQYSDEKYIIPSIHVNLRDSSYYVGEAKFKGKTYKIAIADLNSNGLFDDVEQGIFKGERFFIDFDGNGQFSDGRKTHESFPYGKFTRIDGQWYSIVASPDGGRVEIKTAKPPLGKIEAPAGITAARLDSPTQPLDLEFQNGTEKAVAGTYRISSVSISADSQEVGSRGWTISASFADKKPEFTIREDQTVRLEAGLPLKVEPQVIADEDRTLRISLRITGAGGEIYRWSPRPGTMSKAGFAIIDSSDKEIESEEFEFG